MQLTDEEETLILQMREIKKITQSYIWVRAGDYDDYNKFDNIIDAAEYLKFYKIKKIEKIGKNQLGFQAENFTGLNYISFYYGDHKADPENEITEQEFEQVNLILRNG